MDPDLIAEHEDLLQRRDEAKAAAKDSLAGGNVVELEQQIADVLEHIEAATVVLTLQALPRPRFKALKDLHPPRKDAEGNPSPEHAGDLRLGVNEDTFFDVLLRAEIIAPVLDEETLTVLLDERLTDGAWEALTTVAWNLNLEKVAVPFSQAVSPTRRSSSRK